MKKLSSASHLTAVQVREILERYYSPLSVEIEAKVLKYMQAMEFWGRRMSLTALRDPEEIVRFHFGESIFALSLGIIMAKSRLADVGTGAGFPGLALKLAEPSILVTLIEPNKKKCAFLHEIVRYLEVRYVQTVSSTFNATEIDENSLDVVTSRALGIGSGILKWAKRVLNPEGNVLLWLGAKDCVSVVTAEGWTWGDPRLIPGTKSRYVVMARPKK